MAFLDDILGGGERLTITGKGADPIVVDASLREVHSVSGEVTEHPVETGVDIVDHYRVVPRSVEIEAIITDTPISAGFPGATLIDSATALANGDKSPSKTAWDNLNKLFDSAVVLELSTSLQKYKNMVLTDLTVTRNTTQAQGITFTATAREILFAEVTLGAALATPAPADTTGQGETSEGKKPNKKSNSAKVKKVSATVKAFDAATNALSNFVGGG